jgi:hypothetical protein
MGIEFTIYTDDIKPSRIGGAQFLHRHIPYLNTMEPEALAEFRHMGTAAGYAKKVYGDPFAETSWEAYPTGLVPIWSMQKAYDLLFRRYRSHMIKREIDIAALYRLKENWIFSCIPAPALCEDHPRCQFVRQDVWIVDAPAAQEHTVVYNGYDGFSWYRYSSLFGNAFYEYPMPRTGSFKISKPLRTTCPGPDRPGLYRLGRYGAWEKKALIHHAYEKTLEVIG